ncbi:MAG: 4Fe-4S binding protein [Candidatus Hydrogenedentes bacterium]|nr:4Fe-4S binding protein [Candidatus Hydrogenedentota bacterium]
MRLRTVRRIVQTFCLILFVFLVVKTSTPLSSRVPVDLFMRSSLLAALSSMVASRTLIGGFVVAGVVAVAAILLGRVFCGWICPLGTTIDCTDKLLAAARKARSRQPNRERRAKIHRTKYILLIVALTSAIFGVQIAGWFDPLSIATRTYGMVVYPFINFWIDAGLGAMFNIPIVGDWALAVDERIRPGLLMLEQPVFAYQWLTLLVFASIAALGLIERRYWCRHICPLGAIHDLIGRKALLRRYVKDGCTHCNKCVRECKMNAIDEGGELTRQTECIECFACTDVCPVHVSTFRFAASPLPRTASGTDLGRRGLLTSVFAGLVTVPLARLGFKSNRPDIPVLRPPGVTDETEFLAKCVRCGQCMKVCLTNGLHPTLDESGLAGIFTPRLIPRVGYCEYNCTLCGQVCPSGAIPKLSKEEKHKQIIGTAVFDRNRCIPWAENRPCLVCEEHCPLPDKAIILKKETVVDPITGETRTIDRPYVDADKCVGCGICENKCPLEGESAVRVGPVRRGISKAVAQTNTKPVAEPATNP